MGDRGARWCRELQNFKYLGRPLDQRDNDWPEVRHNVKQAWRVWMRLGDLIRREVVDPKVATMFYREVTQVLLIFGSDTLVLLAAMKKMAERTHTGFMRQITRSWAHQKVEGTWAYFQGRSNAGSSRNTVKNDLHQKKTGDIGTVGGAAAYI